MCTCVYCVVLVICVLVLLCCFGDMYTCVTVLFW